MQGTLQKMILDLEEINPVKQEMDSANAVSSKQIAPLTTSFPSPAQEVIPSGQPIMRVMHTRVELLIYPGGKSFIRNSQTWFEDKIYSPPAKKEKKKAVTKDVQIKEVEEY